MKAILLLLLATFTSSAAPEWVSQLTPSKPGNLPALTPTKAEYSLSWNGKLQAGSITFLFGEKGSNTKEFLASASGSSQGLAAKLFPYQFTMNAKMHAANYAPIYLHSNETDKEETLVTHVGYFATGVDVLETSRPHSTGKDKVTKKNFAFSPAYDLFSAMLYIRGQALDNGDAITICVHPFKTPYLAKIKVLGREKMAGKDAIKMDLVLTKISSKLTLQEYKKMTKATLWISDDADRLPLEFRAAAYIGDVRMSFTKKEKL